MRSFTPTIDDRKRYEKPTRSEQRTHIPRRNKEKVQTDERRVLFSPIEGADDDETKPFTETIVGHLV